jgi:hypothetical protein
MKDQSTGMPSASQLRQVPRHRFLLLATLLSLNALVLGGCIALLIVGRLLNSQLDVYSAAQSMPAASAILDFMDDLIPLYFFYGAVLLILGLGTVSVWTWMVARSRWLRYGVVLLCFILLIVLGGVWLSGRVGVPAIPPMTPTPPVGSAILALGRLS